MKGLIAMIGGGEFEDEMAPVDRDLLGRLDTPRVSLVISGLVAGGATAEELAERGRRHLEGLGAQVEAYDVPDRETAMDNEIAEAIRSSSFVYMPDADPAALFDTLNQTAVWAAIGEMVDNDGIVAMCGGAAMTLGERVPVPPRPLPWKNVFNVFPGAVILPHYESVTPRRMRLLRTVKWGGVTFLGIERHTALFNASFRFSVAGAGGVTVWSEKRHERRQSGDPVLWP
ncbi:MAG: hypothetical protein ACOC5K_02120 [Chloroflexota bacterium]